jgi:tRNA nucleotidyltransferase (CCA-adding enzyme)
MNQIANVLEKFLAIESRGDLKFYFVGGCIRNLLMGRKITDIDMICLGNFTALKEVLSRSYRIEVSPLRTISFKYGAYDFDVAMPRRETYPFHNGVPTADFDADLILDMERRDFTVNTAVVRLTPKSVEWFSGSAVDVSDIYEQVILSHPMFRSDMENKKLSVLHKHSFMDDPSRLMRALKYRFYYGFDLSAETRTCFDCSLIRHLDRGRYLRILWSYGKFQDSEDFFKLLEANLLIKDYEENLHRFDDIASELKVEVYSWQVLYFYMKFGNDWSHLCQLSKRFSRLRKEIEELVAEFTQKNGLKSAYESYKILYNKSVESLIYVYFVGIGRSEIKRHRSQDLRLALKVTGKELIEMGFSQGPEIGFLLAELLEFKLENRVELSKEEEIDWIIKVAHENRSEN